jgi:hypothetical protein
VTRDDEIDAISQFIASNGITRCPAAYAAPTATDLSPAKEARRISRLKLTAAVMGRVDAGPVGKPVAALGVSLGSKPSPASPVWELVWGNRRLFYLIR